MLFVCSTLSAAEEYKMKPLQSFPFYKGPTGFLKHPALQGQILWHRRPLIHLLYELLIINPPLSHRNACLHIISLRDYGLPSEKRSRFFKEPQTFIRNSTPAFPSPRLWFHPRSWRQFTWSSGKSTLIEGMIRFLANQRGISTLVLYFAMASKHIPCFALSCHPAL